MARRARSRKAEVLRSVRGNLFILAAVVAGSLLVVRMQRAATELAPHADKLDYIAETMRTADYDAVSSLPVYALRDRFRDKIGECVKITTRTRPVHLRELPGRLDFYANSEPRPFLSVDFNALKSEGARGEFYVTRPTGLDDERVPKALVALGLLGVYAPDQPCPTSG